MTRRCGGCDVASRGCAAVMCPAAVVATAAPFGDRGTWIAYGGRGFDVASGDRAAVVSFSHEVLIPFRRPGRC